MTTKKQISHSDSLTERPTPTTGAATVCDASDRILRGWKEAICSMHDTVRCLERDLSRLREEGPPAYLIPPEAAEVNRRVEERVEANNRSFVRLMQEIAKVEGGEVALSVDDSDFEEEFDPWASLARIDRRLRSDPCPAPLASEPLVGECGVAPEREAKSDEPTSGSREEAALAALRWFVQFHSGHVLPPELANTMDAARALLKETPR